MHSILKAVILPPTSFFLLFVIGWLLMKLRPALGRGFLWALLAVTYLASTPFFSSELIAPLQPYPAVDPARPDPDAKAIVVLGAGVYLSAPEYQAPGGPPFGIDVADTLSLERIAYAAYLARATGLPILLSGGVGGTSNSRTVAEAMRITLARSFNLTPRWLEEQSKSTMENAEYSAQLLHKEGITKVYLVTHAWHMPRAMMAFERAGLKAVPAPTSFVPRSKMMWRDFLPSSKALHLTYFGVHEWLGLAWYRMMAS